MEHSVVAYIFLGGSRSSSRQSCIDLLSCDGMALDENMHLFRVTIDQRVILLTAHHECSGEAARAATTAQYRSEWETTQTHRSLDHDNETRRPV